MSLQKGDILDEAKRFNESCRVVVEVLDGGAGFSKVDCCGNEMTAEDKVDTIVEMERHGSDEITGIIIDESKNNPSSCGLKMRVVSGGAGFTSVTCCGNELTVANDSI